MTEELIKAIDSTVAGLESLKAILENIARKQAEAKADVVEKSKSAKGGSAAPSKRPEVSPEPSIEDVRKVLADVARESVGARESVKAMLRKYGAERLSDVKESDYAALKVEGERILAERLEGQCALADIAMLGSEIANLESDGLGDMAADTVGGFTEDGSSDLGKVPHESYPVLMKALVALRGSEDE